MNKSMSNPLPVLIMGMVVVLLSFFFYLTEPKVDESIQQECTPDTCDWFELPAHKEYVKASKTYSIWLDVFLVVLFCFIAISMVINDKTRPKTRKNTKNRIINFNGTYLHEDGALHGEPYE